MGQKINGLPYPAKDIMGARYTLKGDKIYALALASSSQGHLSCCARLGRDPASVG